VPIPVPQSLPQRTVRAILTGGAALLLAASVTAGCGAGFDAQTNQAYQSAEGVNGTSGTIAARNFLVMANDEGRGVLHGVLVNTGDTDDRLASIEVDPSVEGVRVSSTRRETPLPAGQAVTLGTATAGAEGESSAPTGPRLTVTGAKPGKIIKMTISFGTAGPITLQVPVITTDHYSPTPKPSAEG
jgi:hypothetical protein